MWTSAVDFKALQARGRWKVEFFCDPVAGEAVLKTEGFEAIGRIARERRETVDPRSFGDSLVNYVGLENVQSLTGELVGFVPRPATEIKSRSKVFQSEDILYGCLRPNLNKVLLVQDPVSSGICSTEFLVLVPDKKLVLPLVLRYLLSSHYVQRHAARLQSGSALPRMNREDLLEIEVPVPSMKVQKELEGKLKEGFKEIQNLRRQLETLPESMLTEFLERCRRN